MQGLQIASALQQHWMLTDVSLEDGQQGFDGRLVKAFTAQEGAFVVKAWPGSDEEQRRRTVIYSFLEQTHFTNFPRPLRSRNGQIYQIVDGSTAVVLEKINGVHAEPTPANYAQLGNIMGRLNRITDYSCAAGVSVEAVRATFPDIATRLPTSIQAEFLRVALDLPTIDSLPQALIHFEMNLQANSLQRADGTIIILDWDEAGSGARILDAGYPLISQFITEDCKFDGLAAEAFYRNYLDVCPLSESETHHLFDASLFHALRYVVWGDTCKRWDRILWAIEHRDMLTAVYSDRSQSKLHDTDRARLNSSWAQLP